MKLPLQQFLDQLQRGCFVPPWLDQHIELRSTAPALDADRTPLARLGVG
jgi:hypothetical protein